MTDITVIITSALDVTSYVTYFGVNVTSNMAMSLTSPIDSTSYAYPLHVSWSYGQTTTWT